MDSKIIKLQSIIRGYLSRKRILIPSSFYQTKQWRYNRHWYKNDKNNECEKYQRTIIEKIIGCELIKTNMRIHMSKNIIRLMNKPLLQEDGFEWTENFDGFVSINNINCYFNLKFIVGDGGAQTRSLREVYHFIKAQLNLQLDLQMNSCINSFVFINIIDGNTSYKHKDKFRSLNHKNIFIGDMKEFQDFYIRKLR